MWRTGALYLVIALACVSGQQSCITPNGQSGRCLKINSCPSLLEIAKKEINTDAEIKLLRDSLCKTNQNGWIVCCGSDAGNEILPDRSQCGMQDGYKVLNGVNTELSEFPWMAVLQLTKPTGAKSWGCGGVLINKRYVLTAAHCFATSKVFKVRLGEWNLDSEQDCIQGPSHESCSPPPQDMAVDEIVTHEGYTRDATGAAINDIALIRLAAPVTLSDFVQPICLPLPTERSAPRDLLYVAGWGATVTKKYSPIKQKLQVPIVDFNKCNSKFNTMKVNINNERQICAGGEEAKDSCFGDSGGPLMGSVSGAGNQYYVEGIISYGFLCGQKDWPGIYTRVTSYLDWIRQHVKP